MILSQDLDYLFGEGHRRYMVAKTVITATCAISEETEDYTVYSEDIQSAEKTFERIQDDDNLHSGSLAVVIDDTDGEPFSLGAGFTSLLEAVADVTETATHQKFYSGDSRQDIQLYIQWAIEFEKHHLGVEWGVSETLPDGSKMKYGIDYMEAIEEWTNEKIAEFKKA